MKRKNCKVSTFFSNTFETTTSFVLDDYNYGWSILKNKRKSLTGIWNFRSFRIHHDKNLNLTSSGDGLECGFFKFNKKKDVLKVFATGLEGCFENAKKGKKQLIGKVKAVDFEDLLDDLAGPMQIVGIATGKNSGSKPSLTITYKMYFLQNTFKRNIDYGIKLKDDYMLGLGKFEDKMNIRGELQSVYGQTVGEFEEMVLDRL